MRFTTFLLLLVSNVLVAQSSDDAAQVKQSHALLNTLIVKREVREAAKLLAPDFLFTSSSGEVLDRDAMLESITSSDRVLEINETENVEVNVQGIYAVVTGVLLQKGIAKGKPFELKAHIKDQWVRTVQGWKIVPSHSTSSISTLTQTYNE